MSGVIQPPGPASGAFSVLDLQVSIGRVAHDVILFLGSDRRRVAPCAVLSIAVLGCEMFEFGFAE